MSEMDALGEATNRYHTTAEEHEKSRLAAIDAAVNALRAGHSPTDVAARSPFTAAYVRRFAREAGIKPAPPGPKRLQDSFSRAGAAAQRATTAVQALSDKIPQGET